MSRRRALIAIDGPVGVGKSTVARALARELGYRYLSTGALYRVVALAARERGIGAEDDALEARLAALLDSTTIAVEGERVLLDGRDVSGGLAEPEIGELASRLSALAVVRARMLPVQRAAADEGGLVVEGRDIGTVVFPDAEYKFFLDAAVAVRAERRFAELAAKGAAISREQVLAELSARDRRDAGRALAPLKCAADAVVIDSSRLSVAQVVAEIRSHLARGPGGT